VSPVGPGPGPDPMKGQPAFPDGLDWGPAELIQDDPKPGRVRRAAQRVGRVLTWPNRALDAALRKWPTRTVAALAAVGVAIMVVYAFGVGEDAGRNRGIALGRQQAAAAASAAASKASPEVKLPRLRSNDGVCGSRLELWDNDKIYSLLLDGPDNFRVLDITEQSKHASGGCSIGFKIPGYPPTEDSTGVESAQVRSGWDRQDNRCARYTVIDGRRWILDSPSLSGFLLHGEGRILAGDPRCGDPAPFRPWGEPDCGEKKWDVVRGWCSWPELVPDGQGGVKQGPN
jgi:hypothetical protein